MCKVVLYVLSASVAKVSSDTVGLESEVELELWVWLRESTLNVWVPFDIVDVPLNAWYLENVWFYEIISKSTLKENELEHLSKWKLDTFTKAKK